MKKAVKLIEILTSNHSVVLPEKYAKVVLQVATLEERVSVLMSFGMVDKSKEMSKMLIELIAAIKEEYKKDEGLD